MKTIFVIFVLCISFSIYAQPFGDAAANFRIIRLDYDNSSGEKGVTDFKYDSTGKIIKSYWSLIDSTRSSNNFYEYDTNGWLISAYREYSDGITSSEIFSYDNFGNKISRDFGFGYFKNDFRPCIILF